MDMKHMQKLKKYQVKEKVKNCPLSSNKGPEDELDEILQQNQIMIYAWKYSVVFFAKNINGSGTLCD